jgi:ABC-type dipeptide/oligopeptide/nickel transport system permease subunit
MLFSELWGKLRRNPLAMIGLVLLVLIIICGVFASVLAPYDYSKQDLNMIKKPAGNGHLLGTDDLGRDVFSRLLYGARISLVVAFFVEIFVVSLGLLVGLTAGFKGGKTDTVLMRVTEVMLAFPEILLAILLLGTLGAGSAKTEVSLMLVILALGLTGWPSLARLVRGQVLSLRKREFVEAARAMGATNSRIILKHILPNLLSPLLVAVTVDVANVVLAEATLSFLGIGIQPPFPSWGRMISDALRDYRSDPRLLICPSIILSLTVLSLNFLGDGLRDALDPRRKQ